MKNITCALAVLLSFSWAPTVSAFAGEPVRLEIGQNIRCGGFVVNSVYVYAMDGVLPVMYSMSEEKVIEAHNRFRNRTDKSDYDRGFVAGQSHELTEYDEVGAVYAWKTLPDSTLYVWREFADLKNKTVWADQLQVFKNTETEYVVVKITPGEVSSYLCEKM